MLAASGDLGASNGTELEVMFFPELGVMPSAMAAYPASDPLVLAVGGTIGNPYPMGLLSDAGTYGGEQAWNEISPFGAPGAGGGAPSAVFDAPPWQRSLHTKDRLVPDVSYNAALVGGALVIVSCRPNMADGGVTLDPTCVDPSRQGYIAVGGTSAGAPQWAAIVALANQVRMSQARRPLGLVSPLLYELAREARVCPRLQRRHGRLERARPACVRCAGTLRVRFRRRAGLRHGDRSRHAERREPARRPRQA